MVYELKIVRERHAGYKPVKRIREAQDIYYVFRDYFARLDREHFVVVLLNTKHRLIGFHVVSVGSLDTTQVHPREVFKPAILANAAAVILVHNHPSGDPEPSSEDRGITQRLKSAGELLGIAVLDHVIMGDDCYVSFAERQIF